MTFLTRKVTQRLGFTTRAEKRTVYKPRRAQRETLDSWIVQFKNGEEPNRNRKPEPLEPFFQEPTLEPELPEAFFRNRNRNRNCAIPLNCAETRRNPFPQRNRRNRKPEPLELPCENRDSSWWAGSQFLRFRKRGLHHWHLRRLFPKHYSFRRCLRIAFSHCLIKVPMQKLASLESSSDLGEEYLGNGRNAVSRVLFRKRELTEFWGKLGEFCEKLGESALHKNFTLRGTH